jgi:hypothetical protein
MELIRLIGLPADNFDQENRGQSHRRSLTLPFPACGSNDGPPPHSLDSDFADDLSRSPLFAALRLPRPGE